ncbi:MAG: triphosphoribosyl-dephospho-CoA synthase [Chloroflexi bacterium]|nr:MAG: triphosphoribosyl-dephospho-CoA synthase [Chloroflexota bacterium]RLC91339.1 MAG: triphosphoribosyl-dephospho-CoA synthase [Chloroflexota bacterium]HEY67677.1 triphosphoribosyl-dephospho-CoA synthase [Thermoflexia bacterium]
MKPLEPDTIAWAVHLACLFEVCADKPGNVTWGKDFWDTRFVDFMASAVAVGPALRDAPYAPIGETILRAVRDTHQLVGVNTNLGMILLLAPLAKAAGLGHAQGLRAGVSEVLRALTVDDARMAFEAIRCAAPGGLGRAERYDVHQAEVDITLREAMVLAQSRDTVAREYVTDFEVTFELGYATLRRLWVGGHKFSDSIVQTALTILAQVPDTLIARKEGRAVAERVSRQASQVLQAGGVFSERGREALRKFDRSIRDERHRLNPGTTADLVAASLFVFLTEGRGLKLFQDLLKRW